MTFEFVIPKVGVQDAAAPVELLMNDEEFAAFYERTARPIWAYLARVSRNPALADDLLQESYLRFLCVTTPLPEGEVARRAYVFRESSAGRRRATPLYAPTSSTVLIAATW